MKRLVFPGYRERVRARLIATGQSQRQFAMRYGFDPNRITRWAGGGMPETHGDLVRFAEALGVTWQWLVTGEDLGPATPVEAPPGLERLLDLLRAELAPVVEPLPEATREQLARLLIDHVRLLVSLTVAPLPARGPTLRQHRSPRPKPARPGRARARS